MQDDNTTPKNNISGPSGNIDGHDFVDLGLKSGNLWARNNVGAQEPYQDGEYIGIMNEDEIIKDFIETTNPSWRPRNLGENKFIPNLLDLGIGVKDWAAEYWKSPTTDKCYWRVPSEEDFQELITFCKWEVAEFDNHPGFLVTGPNGKNIFLPFYEKRHFYGDYYGDGQQEVGLRGCYLSSGLLIDIYETEPFPRVYNNMMDQHLRLYRYGLIIDKEGQMGLPQEVGGLRYDFGRFFMLRLVTRIG